MSKTGQTKNRIIDMIGAGSATLSDISRKLGLHPATVSQHLQELRAMGAIQEVRNQHIKKWKYYKLNPDFDYSILTGLSKPQTVGAVKDNALLYPAVIALVAVAAYLIIRGYGSAHAGQIVQVALTDPPTVPNGTKALYVNYYNVAVYAVGNGTSGWIQSQQGLNGSGTINLLALVNYSELIAGIKVPSGSKITKVRFVIPSAEIIINGTAYSLILRDNEITSDVSGNQSVGPDSEILMDISPVVVPMYINGLAVLVMVPQADSVALSSGGANRGLGSVSKLNGSQTNAVSQVNADLELSNVSLSAVNDIVNFSVKVTNPAKNGIVLRSILVLGQENLSNGTQAYTPNETVPVTSGHTAVEFIVQNNGTLTFGNQQYVTASLERVNYTYPYANSGYNLSRNQSVTLRFSGKLQLLNNITIELERNYSYKVSVLGDYISHLKTNVTAT